MAGIARKILEVIVYLAMLILVIVYFTGEGVFIYEDF
ncbi:hypothetical protein PM3016_145 [Paenibacillus mucilaginosus 3016]|uniref:Teichoic acid D-Ala incorporation-associated protein DltX n=2 Tax=Paenibacillus mucilaginosus TaxID=61624 RepID=H6NTI0_9BACL|nr:hypothetical protein PM3016_145 [Paenibacillus mucilaginosus 3016]AFH59265.1 hypothetical protein B2K_00730 [Paenibacillus mucilaginosus K02]